MARPFFTLTHPMFRKKSLSRRGFTLIELLTVIAIIGILAGMILGVIQIVKKQAKIASTKAVYAQWCSSIEQYKTTYGHYPTIEAGAYKTDKDTIISLDSTANVTAFVKCLTGRKPQFDGGEALSSEDRKKYNRQGTPFLDIDPAMFEKDNNGAYTRKFADAFGNTKLRLIMDTDGNGMVKPEDKMPDEAGADSDGNIGKKVIIYTLKSDNSSKYEDILSWK